MDNNSLEHSKWNWKYHIVFAPKYRRQIIYGTIKSDIGQILRKLCEHKGVEIVEANACKDHIHMLVSIPPNVNVTMKMQKSSNMKMHKYFIVLCSKNIKYITVGNLSLVP